MELGIKTKPGRESMSIHAEEEPEFKKIPAFQALSMDEWILLHSELEFNSGKFLRSQE